MAALINRNLDAVRRENVDLAKRVAALKLKLGITAQRDAAERERVMRMFKLFDRDGNGKIDRDEFQLLSFECGAGLDLISDEHFEATFRAINKAGDGLISFDEFFDFIESNREDYGMSELRLRLMSKKWVKGFQELRSKAKAAKPAEEKKGAAAAAAAAPAAAAAAAAAPPLPRAVSAAGDGQEKQVTFSIDVGNVSALRGGIKMVGKQDPELAQRMRAEVNCPDDVTTFVAFDFKMQDGVDEMKIGELCGMLEVLLDSEQFSGIAPEIYHSYLLDVLEDSKKIRISIFSRKDVSALLGAGDLGDGLQRGDNWGQAVIRLDLSHTIDEFVADPAKRLNAAEMGARFEISGTAQPELLDRALVYADNLPPVHARTLRNQVALARFMRNVQIAFKFGNIQEFLDLLPPGLMPRFRDGVQKVCERPVAERLKAALAPLAQIASVQQELYSLVRTTVAGLDRVHFQTRSTVFSVEFRGLNFFPLLPSA